MNSLCTSRYSRHAYASGPGPRRPRSDYLALAEAPSRGDSGRGCTFRLPALRLCCPPAHAGPVLPRAALPPGAASPLPPPRPPH
eukprot:scaffold93741_cov26-Tisochrysis_lutea.AAC.1